jgi:peroxiredoxin
MKTYLALLSFLTLAAGLACSGGGNGKGQSARLQPGEFETGKWAATVTVPGGDVEFAIELSRAGEDAYGAALLNGEERVPIDSVKAEGNHITLFFPAYNSTIKASLDGGVLEGTLTLVKRGGIEQTMPFRAEFAQGYTFSIEGPKPEVDVSGRWDVTFLADDGETSSAVGEFTQDGTKLTGTFLTATGDYRYLSGSVTKTSIELSCFDGAHAYLFKATVGEDGRLAGDFWSGTKWHERWRARRDESAALPDAYDLTHLKEGYDKIAFSFPGLDGRPVSLKDPRFQGKVVIVTLAGSWCPNCRDEAAFLSRYYDANRSRGLEIVTLMYEHLRDKKAAMTQIERFKKKHNIHYTLLYAGYSGREEAQKTLPMLERIVSYPTMIFIDRSGRVRRIHTGFSGPATGEHYEKFKAEFAEFVDQLLAE